MAGRKKDTFVPFEKGQKVWLDSRNLKTLYHKKIGPKWEGPFEIKEVLGPLTYQLKLPETWKIHKVFHAILLRPYTETEVHGNNYPRPPPDLLEGEEVYTVERILKHRSVTIFPLHMLNTPFSFLLDNNSTLAATCADGSVFISTLLLT